MSAAAVPIAQPCAIVSSGNRGPLSMLVFEGAVVAIFTAGHVHIADRVAQLLERHGLADVPDTVAGLA